MYTFYITQDGSITRDGNTLYFIGPDFKKHMPVFNIREIIISAKVSLSSWALDYLSKLGIIVHILTESGKYMSSLIPGNRNEKGTNTVLQVKAYIGSRRLEIAGEMVMGIKHNILNNLRYYNKDSSLSGFIDQVGSYYPDRSNINKILGTEGNIWSAYYSTFPLIYKSYPQFKREFHPPRDELNAMISYGNALLYTNVLSSIVISGLNPSISFLHEPSERSFSLALDLADIFKPVIVERIIGTLVNKNILTDNDFTKESSSCYLSSSGRKKFIENYDNKLKSVIKVNTNYLSYSSLLDREAYNLLRSIRNNEKYVSYKGRD